MDCQFLMNMFMYLYFQSFIGHNAGWGVASILQAVITKLNTQDQIEVYEGLKTYLNAKHLLGK